MTPQLIKNTQHFKTYTISRSKLDEAHESEADAVDTQSMRKPKGEVQQNIMKIENGYYQKQRGFILIHILILILLMTLLIGHLLVQNTWEEKKLQTAQAHLEITHATYTALLKGLDDLKLDTQRPPHKTNIFNNQDLLSLTQGWTLLQDAYNSRYKIQPLMFKDHLQGYQITAAAGIGSSPSIICQAYVTYLTQGKIISKRCFE